MRRIFFQVAALGLCLACSAQVQAQQVYRWVDEKGITHFGAQPPQGVNAQTITAKSPPRLGGSAPAPSNPVAPSPMANNFDDEDLAQQMLDEQVKGEVMAQEQENAKFCEKIRMDLAQLRNNPRLRYTDEAGQVHYVTEEERQKRIVETQQSVSELCR